MDVKARYIILIYTRVVQQRRVGFYVGMFDNTNPPIMRF